MLNTITEKFKHLPVNNKLFKYNIKAIILPFYNDITLIIYSKWTSREHHLKVTTQSIVSGKNYM